MKIAIINGSPRGKNSNSRLLTDHFMAGLEKADLTVEYETFYLMNQYQTQDAIDSCLRSDMILMAFPLYTDAMPGIVKLFFEKLPSFSGKKIGYMVQSGFPEAIHCFYLEKYLEIFTRKLGATYLGTVPRGNVEGIKDRSARMNKGLYSKYFKLGQYFGTKGEFNPKIIRELKKPFVLPPVARVFCNLVLKTGLSDYGWNRHLKLNNAFPARNARPYHRKITISQSVV
jgi:NAD(P)H-dependent FMN reductase